MKNLLLILLFCTGFAANQLAAQSSTNHCPPGCCKIVCATTADADATDKICIPASCTPEEMKACKPQQTKFAARKAAAGSSDHTAAIATFSFAGFAPETQPAGKGKKSCCAKPAAVKEEL